MRDLDLEKMEAEGKKGLAAVETGVAERWRRVATQRFPAWKPFRVSISWRN